MIPLALWPAWADRHCWDEDGDGRFYGAILSGDGWIAHEFPSTVPVPAGHDWRVPVMRPTVKDSLMVSPAIDLSSIDPEWIKYSALMLRQDSDATDERCAVELDRLLALIDGQASQGCGACGDGCVARGSCRVRDESPPCNSEQPTKGEGSDAPL